MYVKIFICEIVKLSYIYHLAAHNTPTDNQTLVTSINLDIDGYRVLTHDYRVHNKYRASFLF